MQEAGAGEDSFVPAEGVFVALGTAGSSEMARQIGAELNEKGNIRINEEMRLQFRGCMQQVICTGGLLQVAKAVHGRCPGRTFRLSVCAEAFESGGIS